MICEGCGTVFCWDDADTRFLGCDRKRFCGDTCKVKASRRRAVRSGTRAAYRKRPDPALIACARRQKMSWEDAEDATYAADRILRKTGRRLRPYKCPCGSWHLTSRLQAGAGSVTSQPQRGPWGGIIEGEP